MPAEPPPPALTVELSREVRAACRADPALATRLNAIVLRATRRLRARLDAGGGLVRVRGRAEALTIEVQLLPPDICRIERITATAGDGDPGTLTV